MKNSIFVSLLVAGLLSWTACSPAAKPAASIDPSPVAGAPASPVAAPTDELTATLFDMGLGRFSNNPDAPDFHLKDLKGETVSLSSLKGKFIVLNFWATWCGPCKKEMPSLEILQQKYKGRGDIVLLAVNLREDSAVIQGFLKDNPYSFSILQDSDGGVGDLYAVQAIPTTFLIDKSGKAIGGLKGSADWAAPKVLAGLDKLLAMN